MERTTEQIRTDIKIAKSSLEAKQDSLTNSKHIHKLFEYVLQLENSKNILWIFLAVFFIVFILFTYWNIDDIEMLQLQNQKQSLQIEALEKKVQNYEEYINEKR